MINYRLGFRFPVLLMLLVLSCFFSSLTLAQKAEAAVRSISGTAVTIAVSPAAGVSVWGLEETLPEG